MVEKLYWWRHVSKQDASQQITAHHITSNRLSVCRGRRVKILSMLPHVILERKLLRVLLYYFCCWGGGGADADNVTIFIIFEITCQECFQGFQIDKKHHQIDKKMKIWSILWYLVCRFLSILKLLFFSFFWRILPAKLFIFQWLKIDPKAFFYTLEENKTK